MTPARRLSALLLPVCLALAAGCTTTAPSRPGTARALPAELEGLRVAEREAAGDDRLYRVLVAEFAGQRGKLDLALDNYMELAEQLEDPRFAERAARIAVFARDDERALQAARRWSELDPASGDARQILAAMLVRSGDVEGALEQLDWLLNSAAGGNGQRMRMIASFLSREQDKDTVLAIMERLVERHSGDVEALFAYALLAIRTERVEKANEIMAQLVDAAPQNVGVSLGYLSMLQKNGELKTATKWLEQVLERSPEHFELRLVYARLLADAKRYGDAREQFARLAELRPDNSDVQYALGLLYLQGDRLDEAAEQFRKLAEQGSRANEAAYYLGQIAESRQRDDEALEWYEQVYGGDSYFDAQVRIALVRGRRGDIESAREKLHSIVPGDDEQARRLVRVEGEMLAERNLLDEALAVYDAALVDEPDVDLLYTRAMLAERMDRLDLLERDLRAILDIEPDNSQALNALGYTLADRTDCFAEALELIERALALSPDDFYILDSMGWVLYRLGRLEEAADYLRRAREKRDDPEVAAHLAEVLWVLGEKEQARSIWEAALEITPDDETLLETIRRLAP